MLICIRGFLENSFVHGISQRARDVARDKIGAVMQKKRGSFDRGHWRFLMRA